MPLSSFASGSQQIGLETTGPVILDKLISDATVPMVKAMNIELNPDCCSAHIIEWYGEGPHVAQCSKAPGHDGEHVYRDGADGAV